MDNNSIGGYSFREGDLNIGNSMALSDDASFEAISSIQETAKKMELEQVRC